MEYEVNEMTDLQKAELEILYDFDRVCKENGLKYFLTSGTLLGAVRHKGFIPWDDDIDVCMPVADYRRFCKIANKKLKSDYFFQNYETDLCYWFFGKVRKNNTTCIESVWESKNIHQGVWIDIFPLVGVKGDKKWQDKANRRYNSAKRMLKIKFDSMQGKKLDGKKKLLKYIPVGAVRKVAAVLCYSIYKPFDKYENCCFMWPSGTFEERYPKDYFAETVELEFEGRKFPCQKKWDEFLTSLYGDYMTPPPPEKRGGGDHVISVVDLNKNYTEYLKKR